MLILVLELIALFLLTIASISIGWVYFLNHALNSKNISRRWQEKEVGKNNAAAWGVVYEASTYKPIQGAVVKLYNAETKSITDTTSTNKDGKFGFEPPDGKFYLRVNSFYHTFPSIKIMSKNKPELLRRRKMNDEYFGLFLPEIHDKAYENIYFGEIINNRSRSLQRIFRRHSHVLEKIESKAPIILNIPLDNNEILTLDEITLKSIIKQEKALARIKIVSLVLGLLISIVLLVIKPNLLSLVTLELFFLFIFWSIFEKARTKYTGLITDSQGNPLENTLVRAKGYRTKRIRATAISDSGGVFSIPLYQGWYTFEISKDNFETEKRLIKCKGTEETKANFRLKRILP